MPLPFPPPEFTRAIFAAFAESMQPMADMFAQFSRQIAEGFARGYIPLPRVWAIRVALGVGGRRGRRGQQGGAAQGEGGEEAGDMMTAKQLEDAALLARVLVGHNSSSEPLGNMRALFLQLIGEVWRLRAKRRYLEARVKDLERRISPTPEAPTSTALALPEQP